MTSHFTFSWYFKVNCSVQKVFIRILWSSASTWLTVLSSVVAQIFCSLWLIEEAVFSLTHIFCIISFFFGCPGYKIFEKSRCGMIPLSPSPRCHSESMQREVCSSWALWSTLHKASRYHITGPVTRPSPPHPVPIQSIFASNRYSRKTTESFCKRGCPWQN